MVIFHQPVTRRTFMKSLAYMSVLTGRLRTRNVSATNKQHHLSYAIDDKRYNEVPWLTSHNAFANPSNGHPTSDRFYTNQHSSITDQLRYGVRALMLDIYWHEGSGLFCQHSNNHPIIRYVPNIPFNDVLTEITTFMQQEENRAEIITLFFEDYLADWTGSPEKHHSTDLLKYLTETGLWFDLSHYNIAQNGWPTISEMVNNNQRLVAFLQNTQTAQIPYLYDYAVETVYGDWSTDISTNPDTSWVTRRSESEVLDSVAKLPGITLPNTLAIVNHFKDVPAWETSDYAGNLNHPDFLKKHIDYFIWNNARVPNFFALDFVDVGGGDEALAYLAGKQDLYGYSWTSWIREGITWDTEYFVQIPEPYYLVGIDVIDEPGYGITNMMLRATVDYNAQNAEIISAFGRTTADPNRGWVNNEFNGSQRSFLCPNGTYIDAVQVAKHHQWGIVNLRCHLKDYGWSDWITDNEKEDAERLSEFQIVESIRNFHIKYEGGHGLVDLRYSWFMLEIKNIRSAIEQVVALQHDGHTLKTIAFAPNAGWVVCVDQKDVWWKNIPQAAENKIIELYNEGHQIKDIAFTPYGGWAIFYDYNGAWTNGIPQDAVNTIIDLQNNGHELKEITFAPNSGWAIFCDYNGAWVNGIPQAATDKIIELQQGGHELKRIAIAPNTGWAIFFDDNGAWVNGIPPSALTKIIEVQNGGYTLKDIAFAPNGGWALFFGENGAWVNDGLYE